MKSIILWGTGKFARKLFFILHEINRLFPQEDSPLQLDAVVDKNSAKQGTNYEGRPIQLPENVDWRQCNGDIFVAVKESRSIEQYLIENGILLKHVYLPDRYTEYLCSWCETLYQRWTKERLVFSKEQISFLQGMLFLQQAQHEREISYFPQFITENGIGGAAGLFDYLADFKQKEMVYKNLPIQSVKSRPLRTIGIYYHRIYNGGIERVMSQQIPMLRSLGYRVVLLLDVRDQKKEYAIPADVCCVTLGERMEDMVLWYQRFQLAIDQHDIDAIYCHDYLPSVSMLPWFVHALGVRLFAQIHGIFTLLLNKSFSFTRLLYQNVDRIAVLSRVDQLFWRIEGVHSRYLPNPINYSTHIATKRENGYLLWCARVEQEQKQVFDVIPIMKHVKKRLPEAVLHIVGTADSPEILERLKEKIHEENLEENIIFEGYAANPEQYYQKAQICLMTSRFEGFPMVLVEAMAQGVPVVMYDLPYLEIVRQCQGIERVPMNDTEHFAERVVYLLQHPEQLEKREVLERDSLQKFMENNDYQEKLLEFLSCPDDEQEQEVCLQSEDLKILVETLVDAAVKPLWSWK